MCFFLMNFLNKIKVENIFLFQVFFMTNSFRTGMKSIVDLIYSGGRDVAVSGEDVPTPAAISSSKIASGMKSAHG